MLSAQAMAHHGRSFPAALAAGVEAMALAESLGTPQQAALAASALGLAAAVVGDRERCEQAAALLATVDALERRMLGPIGLAYLALNEGRLDDADALYRQISAVLPLGRGFVRWETEWVEALAKSGRRAEGAAVLDELVAGGNRPDSLLLHEYERALWLRRRGRGGGPRPLRPLDRRRDRRGQPVRRGPGAPRRGASSCGGSGAAPTRASTSTGRSSCSRPSAPTRSPTAP